MEHLNILDLKEMLLRVMLKRKKLLCGLCANGMPISKIQRGGVNNAS